MEQMELFDIDSRILSLEVGFRIIRPGCVDVELSAQEAAVLRSELNKVYSVLPKEEHANGR